MIDFDRVKAVEIVDRKLIRIALIRINLRSHAVGDLNELSRRWKSIIADLIDYKMKLFFLSASKIPFLLLWGEISSKEVVYDKARSKTLVFS